MSATPSSVVFTRYPAALSLPSADPSGLAVEAMLRFVNVRPTRKDARLGAPSLTIGASASTTSASPAASSSEVCTGLLPCLRRLGGEEGVSQLTGPDATWVEAVTTHCLFPAFLFAMHFDPDVYQAGMARSVEPKVSSLWEGLTGTYREHVLRANPYFYSGTAVTSVPRGRLALAHVGKLKEVGEEVDRAFAALEALCAAKCTAADVFILGTSQPTYADALVYAAASSFFHADVGETSTVRQHQRRLMAQYPRLLSYTERVRQQFFEADSGTYCLKPHSAPSEEDAAVAMAAAAELQYRRGRLQTLWWTGLFATVYFVLANADMVVALLEETLGAEEEEEMAGAQAAAAAAAAAQAHDGAGARHEPREL